MIQLAKRLLASHTVRLALVVWGFGYMLVDVFGFLEGRSVPGGMFATYIPFLFLGMTFTLLLHRLLLSTTRVSPWLRWPAFAAVLVAVAVLQAFLDLSYGRFLAQEFFASWRPWALVNISRMYTITLLYSWTFSLALTLMWAAGVSNAARLVEARAAAFEAASHRAEAAALRLQLNPHFLFNTLNAIASLIVTGRGHDAEEMLGRLAEFLRAALASDPTADVPLADELATVEAYLAIEKARFSDRMQVVVHVPTDLREARVPNFILQPLVENAVKHGVSRARGPCTVRLSASRSEGEMLNLSVVNQGLTAMRRAPSVRRSDGAKRAGIGLANVSQRLALAYGGRAALATELLPDGFEAVARLPLVIAQPTAKVVAA